MKKAAMIGLDGMPWHILDRLFKWKVMPNLEAITKRNTEINSPPYFCTGLDKYCNWSESRETWNL